MVSVKQNSLWTQRDTEEVEVWQPFVAANID
jgi:hypothetical protein